MTGQRYYIGLAAGVHDPALAIVGPDGQVVFAEATERYLQSKRAYNCTPDDLIRIPQLLKEYCAPDAELVVATTWNKQHLANLRGADDLLATVGAAGAMKQFYDDDYAFPPYAPTWLLKSLINSLRQAGSNLEFQTRLGGQARVVRSEHFDHHLAHAATACYSSPFDEGLCAVIDGFGEQTSCSFYAYQGGAITPLRPRRFWDRPRALRESLGMFYAGLCAACGFDALKGEEWKVMGLAPYGQFDEQLYGELRPLLQVQGLDLVGCPSREFAQRMRRLNALARKAGAPALAAANLAHTGQLIFGELMEELLHNLYAAGLSENLILGGGCALNSSWNGQILDRTRFKRLHVFAAPADDGNAIGAAQLAFQRDHPDWRPTAAAQSPYLGSTVAAETLANMVRFGRIKGLRYLPGSVCRYAAELLARGRIIGWVQGRAEFGPRALGNRSILADARPPEMKDRINALVKFREEFRPFAPSILHEFGADYFEHYQESPYMERTLRFRPEAAERVPAVVHVDGTGRLQSVREAHNPKFHQLIKTFHGLTDVPLILNTSFNIMGKPIIHSVEDALGVFFTTGLDALVIEDYVIEKDAEGIGI